MSIAWAQAPVVTGGGDVEYGIQRRGLESAVALVERGSYGDAIALYRQLVNQGTEGERGQARLGLAAALAQMGQEERAVRALEGTVADETPLGRSVGELRGRLLLQLAEKDLHTHGPAAAQKWLAQYARLADAPDNARYNRLMAAAGSDGAVRDVNLQVGVLLPLSGNLERIGKDVLDGLGLAVLDGMDWPNVRVELKPYDTATLGAADAARMALNDGADILVGPLVSKDVDTVAPLARSARVPVLGLSTDRAAAGNGVWLAGYLAADQGRAMAAHAASQGLTRVAGLVPSNPYGYELFDAFKQAAMASGVEIVASTFYNPDNVDMGASIRSLAVSKDKPLPFNAVFMPSSAAAMPLIASQLAAHNIKPGEVALLGTALWQDPSLLSPSMASTVQGAIFAVPPREDSFTAAFKDAYDRAPLGLAIVGYDIGNWLGELAFEAGRTGQRLEEILLRPEGFYGAGGYARFLPGGESQRGLSVVRVANAQFDTVVPGLSLMPLPLPRNLLPAAQGRGWWW